MSNIIVLERFAYSPDGTFGKIVMPDGSDFYTVELPWKGNKRGESCIPEGIYTLGLRYSPVVKSSSGEEFNEGWEVQDVPDRDYIMIHPGNWPFNFKGCIGLGYEYKPIMDRSNTYRNAVTQSRAAFREFMGMMESSSTWDLEIIPKMIQYP
jgi:hypothetical protein